MPDPSKQMQMCLFTVGASWVRMRAKPPKNRDIRELLFAAYPELLALDVDELAWRMLRLRTGLLQYRKLVGPFSGCHVCGRPHRTGLDVDM